MPTSTGIRRATTAAAVALAVALVALAGAPLGSRPAGAAEVEIAYEVGSAGSVSTDVGAFAAHVGSTLDDLDGWSLGGSIEFVPVDGGADLRILIAEPAVIGGIPGCSAQYSCHVSGDVYINEDRWNQGAAGWSQDLDSYRHYVVNHEVGHYLGLDHVDCPGAGDPAPVMMQQTIQTEPCRNRVWPLPYERRLVADRYGVTVRSPSEESLGYVRAAHLRTIQRLPAEEDAHDLALMLDSGDLRRVQLLNLLLGGSEHARVPAPVSRVYFASFLRPPDADGIFYWGGELRRGRSLRSIAQFFASSQEFRDRYGDLGTGGFVERLYLNVLGRSSDPDGREYWESRLRSGEMTRGEVLVHFAESGEHRDRRDAEVTVAVTYVAILDRAADPTGLDHWSGRLESGEPRQRMVEALVSTDGAVL